MKTRLHKTYHLSNVKAVAQDGQGIVDAIVSVFGNVDLVGDRVVKGAFAKSIETWRESGKQIPVIFSHQWDNLDSHVGAVDPKDGLEEKDEGLWTRQVYDLDDPAGLKTFRLIKSGRLTEFSFAYDVVREKKADDGANELLEVNLIEVGPTLKGANPDTFVLAVKSQKALGTLAGSAEERRELVNTAARAEWGAEERWVWVVATFDDRAIVSVDSPDGTIYYEVNYVLSDDGATLSDPREVDLETTVAEKSVTWAKRGEGWEGRGPTGIMYIVGGKAGRALSAKNETKLRDASQLLQDVLASVDDDGKSQQAPAPEGKDDEPTAKSEDPKVIDARSLFVDVMDLDSRRLDAAP